MKIAPPLKPKQPEAQPPRKAVVHTDLIVALLNLMSLGIRPLPTLVFNAYSANMRFIATTDTQKQIAAYSATNSQSITPQCSIPTTDGIDLLPLKTLMMT